MDTSTGPALVRSRSGACLGLLGMEERATLAGGRLEVRSTLNHGTEIRAHFPLVKNSAPV